MTETTSKVEKWSYPLKVDGAEATDPQQFYNSLAKAKDGYYPLGANGLWHGGVHFDEGTGLVKDLTEVRCIADGEVVAYRIDEAYPKSDFGSTQSVYSTGFVLVKHRLEFPTPPAPAAGTAPAAGPSLTFFSLYMHLLDWETYKAKPTLTNRPGFWGKGLYRVKSNLSTKSLGLSVRAEGKKQSTLLAVLPRGTTVLTKPAPAAAKWLEIVSVTPEIASLASATGWVYKGEMKHLVGEKYFIGDEATDVPPDQKIGANVRDATSHGLPITFLPAGTQVRISDEQAAKQYRKLVEIVSGQSIPALTAGADGKLPGFVWLDDLEPVTEPHSPMGEVVLLTPTFKIKAGEVLGHVGKYQSHSDPAPKNLLHLEVFSCEDVNKFTQQCQDKAGSLPAAEKTLLKVQKKEKLIIHAQGMDATNPPKTTDPFNEVGYEFMIPVGVLETLPAEKKIKAPVIMGGTTSYTFWWHLENLLADEGGNPISGWYAEPDTTLSRHSRFEWEGFTFIDETVSNVDHLAAFLHAQENLNEVERASYLPNIESANDSITKQQLYKILDKNDDKKVSQLEIKEALNKPWFSQSIAQIITRYESEWQYKKEKWDSLDELMGHADSDPHKGWMEEKLRVERLSWWDKLVGQHGITSDINVQHIHPVGLVANCKVVAGTGRKAKPWSISAEGISFLKQYESFRANMYNDSAGHATIGYGHLIHHGHINGAASETPFLQGLTVTQAEELLKQDLAEYEARVNNGVSVELAQHEYDALVIFAFNIGGPGFTSSAARATVNQLAYGEVGEKMKMWNKITGPGGTHVVSDGLVNRRAEEVEIFENADYVRTR